MTSNVDVKKGQFKIASTKELYAILSTKEKAVNFTTNDKQVVRKLHVIGHGIYQ